MQLDNIINDLVDKSNAQKNGKRQTRPKSTLNIKTKVQENEPEYL